VTSSRALRTIALGAHALLIAGLAWLVGISAGLLLLFPLLTPVRGLWRGERYTYAWASMLLVFYCGGLLAEAYMRPHQGIVLRLLASVAAIEFVSLVLFVRAQSAAARAAAAAAPPAERTAE
jgi:uncharacterized membrane protein